MYPNTASLPTRGAWIEIASRNVVCRCVSSRSPHGERGLKSYTRKKAATSAASRSPHGERGLKLAYMQAMVDAFGVAPHTGSVD